MTPAAAAAQSETPHGFTRMLLGFAKYVITVSQVLLHWTLTTSRLLETGQGSDMTVTCKGKVFKVHSAIVASRSDFFATACWGGFKVSVELWHYRDKVNYLTRQEAENHCIDLPDDDPAAVGAMLQYLYTLTLRNDVHDVHDDCISENREEQSLTGSDEELGQLLYPQLVFDIAMYRMGDKYGIPDLKDLTSDTFAITLEWYTEHISARALAALIRLIYDSTPESDPGLRHPVLAYAKQHLKSLLALEDFKTVLAEIPDFSYQLLVQEVESRVGEEPATKKS